MYEMMNSIWNSEGSKITGRFEGFDFTGTISNVRSKAGKDLAVYVIFDQDSVKNTGYDGVVINGSVVVQGGNSVFKNINVFLD